MCVLVVNEGPGAQDGKEGLPSSVPHLALSLSLCAFHMPAYHLAQGRTVPREGLKTSRCTSKRDQDHPHVHLCSGRKKVRLTQARWSAILPFTAVAQIQGQSQH